MIRVMIVDDQEMIRQGLRAILAANDRIEVVADVADGYQAVEVAKTDQIDVILMDIRMPGIDGVETIRRIREFAPTETMKIVVLTTFDHDATVLTALQAGANGFLSKSVSPTELAAGIEAVSSGGGALSGSAAASVITHVSEQPARAVDTALAARFAALTPREREVVIAAAEGKSNTEIATVMFVSPFTVKTHANRAMAKVGARDRAQLIAFAYQAGLLA
ncbi:response regulator transcription factor [Rhodococcus sp. KBS0724]|jgi:DNA-binding NarL/FixJ family response regulator|uniref:response regulator transcription factor n=1 Tax=Rhodococcus sp. KBS0724 TaxID=1179674 RepID=UPI00110D304B|nr:response regulator transcription factor [Rhodococcus sp. KBS0724]TSD49971.1 response regulator transcription factor [Rhodococcus sp. KBS0724]